MAILKRALVVLGVLLLIPVVVLAAAFLYLTTAPGLATVASLTSRYASSPDAKISIGTIEGSFPTDLTVRDLRLADREGEWLAVDRARIVWSPLQLFSRKLTIDLVDVGHVQVARAPEIPPSDEPDVPVDPDAPLFPQLPIEIRLGRLLLADLDLAQPVIGVPARLSASASATIRQPSEGVAAEFELRRIDGVAGQIEGKGRFIPATDGVELTLKGSEPAGGLVARLAEIPGLPPINIGVQGSGTLDALRAQLVLTAGEQGRIDGAAEVNREGEARRIKIGLNGDVSRLVQPAYASLVEGTTRLTAEALAPDEGPIQISDVTLDARSLQAGVRGTVDPTAETIAISYDLKAGEVRRFDGVLPAGLSWVSLAASGTANGPLDHPEVKATIDGGGLAAPQGGAETARIVLTATPDGPLTRNDTRVSAVIDATATGVKFADDRLFTLGRDLTVSAEGATTLRGDADVRRAEIKLADAVATYAGQVSPEAAKGRATLKASDLSTLAALAGRPLAGAVDLTSNFDLTYDLSRLSADIVGEGSGLKTGYSQVDALSGGAVSLSGGVTRAPDGSFAFRDLRVTGEHVRLTADGSATQTNADAKARAVVDDLALVDSRLSGAATVDATLSGRLEDLGLKARLSVPDGRAMDRPLKDFTFDVDATDVTDTLRGVFVVAGSLDGEPLRGGGRIVTEDSGARRVEALDVTIASAVIKGDVTVAPTGLATGELAIDAADLSDLGALALTELSGSLKGDVALSAEGDVQRVVINAKGADLAGAGARAGQLDVAATVIDPAGKIRLDGTASAAGLSYGDHAVDKLALIARGAPDGMDVTLDMSAQGSSASAAGRVVYGPAETKIDVARLDLAGGGKTGSLNAPARLRLVGSELFIDAFSLRAGEGGVLNVAGKAGGQLDLTVGLRALPLALGNAFTPGLGLGGMLEGDARVTGLASAPDATFNLKGRDLSIAQLREAKVPPLALATTGRLEGDRIITDTRITGAGGVSVTAQGAAPLGAGELDMSVGLRAVPLALANAFMPDLALGGVLQGDAKLAGPLSAPRGTYDVKVADFVSGRAQGVPPLAIAARGALEGARVTTDATITGGGGISVTAQGVAPLGKGDVDMTIAIRDLPLKLANAVRPDLGLAGALRGDVRLSGPIDAPRGNYDLRVSGLTAAMAQGVPALQITTHGALEGRRLTTRTVVTGGGVDLSTQGVAPIGDGDLDMDVVIRSLPLQLASAVAPDVDVSGTLRGTARLTGPLAGPSGSYDVTVVDVASGKARGVPALRVAAKGALAPKRITTDATITGGGGVEATVQGAAPIGDGDLDLDVALKAFPLAIANAFVPRLGLAGAAQGEAKLLGPIAAPRGTYALRISGLDAALLKGAPPLQVDTRGTLEGKRVTTETRITGGELNVVAKGSAPLDDGDVDMTASIRGVPLALANNLRSDLGLAGLLRGDVKLSGPVRRPVGTYDLQVSDLVSTQAKGVPPLQVAARGDLQGERVTTDATVTGEGGISLTAKGSAPLGDGDVDMAVAVSHLPLALANSVRPELGLAGTVRGDATVKGPVTAPRGDYDLTIVDLTSAAAKGVPALKVVTKGAFEGQRVTTDTAITGGGGIEATARGSAPIGEGDIDMDVVLRELPLALANAVQPSLGLAGSLRGTAKVSGPLAAPRGTYDLAVTGLTSARAKGAPPLQVAARGELQGERVTTDAVVTGAGGINLTAKGSAPLGGAGAVDMAVAVSDLPLSLANAVSPELGLGGKLKANAQVGGTIAAPQGTYDLTVTDLTAAQARGVAPLQVVAKGNLEGQRLTTDAAITGGGGVRATAKGAIPLGSGDADLAIDVARLPLAIANGFMPSLGLGGALAGSARVTGPLAAPGGRYDLRVTNLTSAQARGVPAMTVTAKGDLANGRVTTDAAVTGGGGLRLTANGSAGLSSAGPLDLTVALRSVPLALANGFSPGLGAQGTLQGDAKLGGTIAAPTGSYTLRVTSLSTAATRSAGVPAAQIESRGQLQGDRVSTDTVVTAARGLRVTARGTVPLGSGNLDLAVAGRAPLAFLNDTLSISGDRIDGVATFDVKLGGPTTAPRVNGTGRLENGSYFNRAAGLQLRGIQASIVADGPNIDVRSLRATTRNGGTISGSGRVAVNPGAGFPGEITFRANNAELIGTDIVTAITDADLRLQGPLARRPVVRGVIRTRSVEIQIPDRIPARYTPLPNVRHKGAPPAVLRQFNSVNAGKKKGGSEEGFLATLDIDVEADNRIFIRGMGMQAEAGGQIKITGTSANPIPVGAFQLRPGRSQITVIGHRLEFTRGSLSFAGDLDPSLDFLAETRAGDITAQVVITGTASAPQVTFTSNPTLPTDEVLARLLFNKSSGELSPTQALQLAQAVAEYSGVGGGGSGPLESLRKGLGVDSLDLGAGQGGGFGVGVSRYISDNIYLGFRTGTTPEDTGITADIDLTKHVKARAEAGAAGNASAGVAVQWDY